MPHILYSTEAEENLHDIFTYTADKWGIEQARKYYYQLSDAFSLIAKNPKLGHKHSYIAGNYYTYLYQPFYNLQARPG